MAETKRRWVGRGRNELPGIDPNRQGVPDGGTDLAWTAVCVGPCGRTFVSALRAFPFDYVCIDCVKAITELLAGDTLEPGILTQLQMNIIEWTSRKTCSHGHPKTQETWRPYEDGYRCLTCNSKKRKDEVRERKRQQEETGR